MKRDFTISVAMATYNGEKYIKEQINSILVNLDKDDELVISDDGSTDETINIIQSFNDHRIKLISGPKLGVIQNFQSAIKNCKGKFIFLSDQDDIWVDTKVEKILECFEKENCNCIVHDCTVVNSNKTKTLYNSFFEFRKSKKGLLNNIIKNSYIGCCMAFDRNLLKYILPFPKSIPMHDQWIGLISEKKGNSYFLNEKLIYYRRHEGNSTELKHLKFCDMLKNRFRIIKNILFR